MNKILTSALSMPLAAILLMAASFGSIGFALVMQYGFDYQPCILCLWQRVPFVAGGILALIALLWRPFGRKTRILLAVIAFVLALNTGLAMFHSGVERHWWLGTSGCTIQPLHSKTPESLREELLRTAVAHCDEISWSLFGLSMANYNVPFSLLLALFAGLATRKNKTA